MYNQLNNVEKVAALKVLLNYADRGYSTDELKRMVCEDKNHYPFRFISEDDLKYCKGTNRWNSYSHSLKNIFTYAIEEYDLTWLEPKSKTTEMVSLGHDDLYRKVEKVVYQKGCRYIWHINYNAINKEIASLIEDAKAELRNKIENNNAQIGYLANETEKLRNQLFELNRMTF